MSDQGTFRKVGEREIHSGRVIRVSETTFEAPDGREFNRDVVHGMGAVSIVPLLDGPDGPLVVCVRQYRGPIEQYLLEIPAGLRDKPGEEPEATAQRELAEEVGLAADELIFLTRFFPAAGMTDQHTYVYLATGLTDVGSQSDGVEEEFMTVEHVALRDAPKLIASGDIVDGKTIVGMMLAREHLGLT